MDSSHAIAPVLGALDGPAVVDLAGTFFALLALLVNAVTLAIVALIASRGSPAARRTLEQAREVVGAHGVGATAAVTGTATLGSLYYSEVVGFIPCALCWYQRIFAYPLAVILTVALIRHLRDLRHSPSPNTPAPIDVWRYAVPLALLGLPISVWHWLVERFPGLESGACDAVAPCSAIYVERFGFVSLPWMAGTSFVFVLGVALLLCVTRPSVRAEGQVAEPPLHR